MTLALLVGGLALVFVGVLLALSLVGVVTPERKGLGRSLAVLDALSSAPTSLSAELDKPFQQRVLDPVLSRALGMGRRLTPADHGERMRNKLDRAGNPPGVTVDRLTSAKVVGFGAFLAIALVLSLLLGLGFTTMLLVCVAASLVGYMAPDLWLYQKAYERTEQMQKGLADALDLLTISVESGLGFDAALAHVAKNTEGPLSEEFARVLQEMQIGRGRSEALRSLGDRTTVDDLRAFVGAMVQADAFGIPIGQVLRVQSSEIRVKRRQWAEEKAQQVPVKIMVPLIFCVLPGLFIVVLGPAGIQIMENLGGR